MLNLFENKIAGLLKRHNLLDPAERFLLAISGGADSVALVFALHRIVRHETPDTSLIIAHINHNLRGAQSDSDENFVIELTRRLSLDVVTRSVDVKEYASRKKLSIETAARILRLNALARLAGETRADAVATAHHADDNAETLIHRLLRGTGFRGLAGILPERKLACDAGMTVFIRPMLCVRRSEIIEYCRTNNLSWRHDHTNDDCAYTRNRIRRLLIPHLQRDCKHDLAEQLLNLSQSARKLSVRIDAEARAQWPTLVTQEGTDRILLGKTLFSRLPDILAVEIARRAITSIGSGERNLTQQHYANILDLAKDQSPSQISLPEKFIARTDRQHIIFEKAPAHPQDAPTIESKRLNIPGVTEYADYTIEASLFDAAECNIEQFKARKDNSVEWFDYDRIVPPLIVRKRKPGDRFHPFAMPHEKKAGKFLTAARIDPQLRNQLLVIADAEKIVWLAPVRPSEKTRLTGRTQRILQLWIKG